MNLQSIALKAMLYLQKIPSIYIAKEYLIWLLIVIELKYNTNLKICKVECSWNNFAVVIWCLHAVFACFKTNIYSKFFRFLTTTTEKRVIWRPQLVL